MLQHPPIAYQLNLTIDIKRGWH